jgi:hypothetical protein
MRKFLKRCIPASGFARDVGETAFLSALTMNRASEALALQFLWSVIGELGFLWILELEIWNFCPATLIFREWRSAPEASTLNRNVAERRGDN